MNEINRIKMKNCYNTSIGTKKKKVKIVNCDHNSNVHNKHVRKKYSTEPIVETVPNDMTYDEFKI